MAAKSGVYANDLLKLIFNAVTIAGLARDEAAPVATLSIALHTGDPGAAGTQATSEAAYTGYARQTVARTTGSTGWTVTLGSVSPTSVINFGECTGTPGGNITYWSVGTAGGTPKMLYYGPVSPAIVMGLNVIPQLKVTSTVTET